MKKLIAITAALLSGCAMFNKTPSQDQVQQIQIACAADAAARPIAQATVAIVGTPAELAGLAVIEKAIDAECANPTAAVSANELATLNANIATVSQLVANLTARQNGKPEPYPNVTATLAAQVPAPAAK